jgi:hypothetical protein
MKRSALSLVDEEVSVKKAKKIYPVAIEPEDDLPIPYTPEEVYDMLKNELGLDFLAKVDADYWMRRLQEDKTRLITTAIFVLGICIWAAESICVEQFNFIKTEPFCMPYSHEMVDIALSEANWIEQHQELTHDEKNEWIYLLMCDQINFEAKEDMVDLQRRTFATNWNDYVTKMQNLD